MLPATPRASRLVPVVAAVALLAAPCLAQEEGEDERNWSDSAELSLVATEGNSESQTLGFKNVFKKWWDSSGLEITASGIRTETTSVTRTAVGTPGTFTVTETKTTETTAETYLLKGRFDRKITSRFFWYAGGGWDRNRPAGVQNRYNVVGGIGNIWYDQKDLKFRTDYALTYTDQEDVVPNPLVDDTFLGARFSWDYLNRLSRTAVYENQLVIDENLDETDDLRVAFNNSIAVAMTDRMALKASYNILFDSEPSFVGVPLFDAPPPGGTMIGTVPVQLDEVDTFLSVSLVIDF